VGSLAGTADVGLVDGEMSAGEKIIGNGVDCYLYSTLTRRMAKQESSSTWLLLLAKFCYLSF
jgi:hypothetical protein